MRRKERVSGTPAFLLSACCFVVVLSGCGPDFRYLRVSGQSALRNKDYGVALDRFRQAYERRPGDAENLYDLGRLHLERARARVAESNDPAAMRELDRSIAYFSQAIQSHPGMQAAVEGKNEALELEGRFDEALRSVEWASAFVGPGARARILLAKEFEERGDYDAALLRFRQAVAMERENATAHAELGMFMHRRGNRAMAVRHLTRAYQLNPLEAGVADLLTSLGEPLPRTVAPERP